MAMDPKTEALGRVMAPSASPVVIGQLGRWRSFMAHWGIETRLFVRDRWSALFHILLPLAVVATLAPIHEGMRYRTWNVVVQGGTDETTREFRSRVGSLGVALQQETSSAAESGAVDGRGVAVDVVMQVGKGYAERGDLGEIVVVGPKGVARLVAQALAFDAVAQRGESDNAPHSVPRVVERVVGRDGIRRSLAAGMIAMMIGSTSLFGVGVKVAQSKERGFLLRWAIAPGGIGRYLLVHALHRASMVSVQSVALLAVFSKWDADLIGRACGLAVVGCTGSVTFTGLGYVIAGATRTSQAATAWAHALFFPMLVLGGAFTSMELLPPAAKAFGSVLPAGQLVLAVRETMMGSGWAWQSLACLAVWAALFAGLARWGFDPRPRGG